MQQSNTYRELQELIPTVMRAGKVPFIQGNPGVGKSTFWRAIAKQFNLKFIDIRLSTFDPTMFNGFLWKDEETGKAGFMPLDVFPIEGDALPFQEADPNKKYDGFLVHLDEFTQAPKSVEGAAFQLVLDRMVGALALHSKCKVVCSGNPVGKGMIAKPISTPMRSRLVHFQMENHVNDFTMTMAELQFHPVIINFINSFGAEMLNNFEKMSTNVDGTYACERSWEAMSDLMKQIEKDDGKVTEKHLPIIIGTIGDTAAASIFTFIQNYYSCPDINKIIADPEGTPVPDDQQDQYASTAYLVTKADDNNGQAVAKYLERFDEEFQLIFGRILLNKDEPLFDKHFSWLTDLVVKYAI